MLNLVLNPFLIFDYNWNKLPNTLSQFASKIKKITLIIFTESYATFKNVLPGIFKWHFRKYWQRQITTDTLSIEEKSVSVKGYLNRHGKFPQFEKNQTMIPLLFTHGDLSHSCTLLHLIDKGIEANHLVFSLYLPNCNQDELSDLHDSLLKEAINKIKAEVEGKGMVFGGIKGIGHSKGAILLAKRQFVGHDPDAIEILETCAIAGRLAVPHDSQDKENLPDHFRKLINTIQNAIYDNPELKLTQIVPKKDWNACYESMAVRPEENCYSVPGMHLSGLFEEETVEYVKNFMG